MSARTPLTTAAFSVTSWMFCATAQNSLDCHQGWAGPAAKEERRPCVSEDRVARPSGSMAGSDEPEWWNGIHGGLKIPCPQGLEGSKPSSGTTSASLDGEAFFVWDGATPFFTRSLEWPLESGCPMNRTPTRLPLPTRIVSASRKATA